MRALPFVALLALSLVALALDASVRGRVPSTEDWAQAAAALRTDARPGDAVQPWPPWLERARVFVDAAPVEIEEDLARADFVGVERLWLLAAPGARYAGLAGAERLLLARGAIPGGRRRFGALELEAWALRSPALAGDLTGAGLRAENSEFHEVDYVARRCRRVRVGRPHAPERLPLRGVAGTQVHLRAGLLGEHAYALEVRTIHLELRSAGSTLAALDLARTVAKEPGWRGVDAAVPAGEDVRDFELLVSSSDQGRPVCVAVWTTR
jgi:hypothetical protein